MEKIFRSFDNHQQADAASLEDARRLTTTERLTAFLQLMKPVYESSYGMTGMGLQRIYRTRDLGEVEVPGDWRVGF